MWQPSMRPRRPSLLLVQSQTLAARALGRFLRQYYDEVFVAETPEAAEHVLRCAAAPPSHLICGEDFGPDRPRGCELVPYWRQRYPDITRAILATGAEGLKQTALPGIDGVFAKPAALSQLLDLLQLRRTQRSPAPQSGHVSSTSSTPTNPTPYMEQIMNTKTPKAHNVDALKERLNPAAKPSNQPAPIRTAQGFTSV